MIFLSNNFLPRRLNKKPTCEQLREDEEVNYTNKVSHEVGEDDEEGKSIFLELPVELQESIAKRVPVGQDYMNFRAVCRTWRSIAPPCRWRYNASTTIPYPWLVLFQREKETFNFRDPRDNGAYYLTITAPELSSDCVIWFAKDDYLLVSQGERSIFVFEPLTNKRIQLPDMAEYSCMSSICVSTSPIHSENWVIFGFESSYPGSIFIYFLCSGRKKWVEEEVDNERPFRASRISPVYLDGSFYCLGQDGSLGVFKQIQPAGFSWKIFSNAQQLKFPSTPCWNFLVSVDEEGLLLSVFVGNSGDWVHVYKRDKLESEWVKLSSLGHLMLFVNETSSLAVEAKEETMSNKIYFPFFTKSKGNNLFYSLESGKFQSFDPNDHLCGDLKLNDTTQSLHSAWIQPRLVPTFSRME